MQNLGSHVIIFNSLRFGLFTLKRNLRVFKLKRGLQCFDLENAGVSVKDRRNHSKSYALV